jgi:Cd2+/Zn2+-exporting ATPase
VAWGAAGSDVALQSADVALMSDRLDRLPEAIRLSRRALGIMRVNVVASLAIKAVFVALAPFGLVTLVVAVAADMGMSLLVTLNALRLIRTERRDAPVAVAPRPERPATADPCTDECCSPAPGAAAGASPALVLLPLVQPQPAPVAATAGAPRAGSDGGDDCCAG